MEWKVVSFKFPRRLSQDQEDCFIAAFQAIVKKAKENLKRAKEMSEKNPLSSHTDQGRLAINSMEAMLHFYDDYVRLESDPEDETRYLFKLAHKNLEGFSIKIWKLKLSHWKRLQDIMTTKVRKEVCRKIQISPNSVKVEFFTMADQEETE